MAFMVHHLKTDDFDTFKSRFDADPVGRKQSAKGHVMLRSVDNPNEVFTRVEFDSVEAAEAATAPDKIQPLVADFDRVWGDRVKRRREVLEVAQELAP